MSTIQRSDSPDISPPVILQTEHRDTAAQTIQRAWKRSKAWKAVQTFLLSPDNQLVKQELTRHGWTPLHLAASLGDEATVRLLVHEGEDECAVTHKGYIPLSLAVLNGHESTAAVLSRNILPIDTDAEEESTAYWSEIEG